jgi:glycosyltransferase involved in cell wall biosynthesis
MGKKSRTKPSTQNIKYPLVSLCTPTFNRRPFIPYMIKCFEHQTYPKECIEWIIIDDGTDPIGELVSHIPQVKYYYYEEKMVLGKKRNLMHSKCSGDIIIYMDDDDYYPPERITHAVTMLQKNPKILFAGSSEMHIFYESKNAIYQCGPYGPNHATAATFAFKKELLLQTNYENEKALAEESAFTKGYTIPMVQLDTLKTILVFSHKHNSLNKEKLLERPEQTRMQPSRFNVDDFVKEPELKQFYTYDMNKAVENYEPGKPEHKPQLLEQLKKIEEEREKRMAEHHKMMEFKQKLANGTINNNKLNAGNESKAVELDALRNEYEKKLSDKNIIIEQLIKKVKFLTGEIESYKQLTGNKL